MPNFAVKQHDDMCRSTYGRRHLNLLLEDQCKENQKIYGPTGKTGRLQPPPEEPAKEEVTASPTVSFDESQTLPKTTYKPAYQELSKARAKEVAMQVSSKRTPTGAFFSPVNPVLVSEEKPTNSFTGADFNVNDAAYATVGITRQRNAVEGSGDQSVVKQTSVGFKTQESTTKSSQQPWLMPWQTGDRDLGRRMADAINNRRTPIGAFANFDLAKSNK